MAINDARNERRTSTRRWAPERRRAVQHYGDQARIAELEIALADARQVNAEFDAEVIRLRKFVADIRRVLRP